MASVASLSAITTVKQTAVTDPSKELFHRMAAHSCHLETLRTVITIALAGKEQQL